MAKQPTKPTETADPAAPAVAPDNSTHTAEVRPKREVVPLSQREKPEPVPLPEGPADGVRVVILADHVFVAPDGDNQNTHKVEKGTKVRLPADQARTLIDSKRAVTLD